MSTPSPRGSAPARPVTELAARPGPRLLWEADALLALIPQLRASGFVSDLRRLHAELSGMLRDFQARARRDGIEPARVAQASEVLAAAIDHVVTSMPWGADASWQSLGAQPVSAGARPGPQGSAARLLEVAHRSSSDRGMRELISIALALGFDGGAPGAEEVQINQLRGELAAHGALSPRIERALSPPGQSTIVRGSPLAGWLPLWVSSAVVAALLAALFLGLVLSLAATSDRLYARIATLNAPPTQNAPLPAPQPRLAGLLDTLPPAAEVRVHDEIDRSILVIPGAGLFAPGEAQLLPRAQALLRPVAAALQRAPGRIQVIGYTGSGTVRAARYPSDWDLSVERAHAAEGALQQLGLDSARLSYDGRAAFAPPAAPDESAPGSRGAGDGRIEIVLLAGR
ncbi:MAG TPA: DotU family type IV/VI secretion system protein [Steroidobacteraceae bacterium]|nr:DotU family type IV/VI secretion system protein [Steroidobacteraceae bacterium]